MGEWDFIKFWLIFFVLFSFEISKFVIFTRWRSPIAYEALLKHTSLIVWQWLKAESFLKWYDKDRKKQLKEDVYMGNY